MYSVFTNTLTYHHLQNAEVNVEANARVSTESLTNIFIEHCRHKLENLKNNFLNLMPL